MIGFAISPWTYSSPRPDREGIKTNMPMRPLASPYSSPRPDREGIKTAEVIAFKDVAAAFEPTP